MPCLIGLGFTFFLFTALFVSDGSTLKGDVATSLRDDNHYGLGYANYLTLTASRGPERRGKHSGVMIGLVSLLKSELNCLHDTRFTVVGNISTSPFIGRKLAFDKCPCISNRGHHFTDLKTPANR